MLRDVFQWTKYPNFIYRKVASLLELLKAEHIKNYWNIATESLEEAYRQIDINCVAELQKGSDKFLV